MILQALVQHYHALAARGMISPTGWCKANVSFALELGKDGSLAAVIPMKIPSQNGKKEVPQPIQVPEQAKKSSGVKANFLCDSSSYLLGIDNKGKPDRTQSCFTAAKELHHAVLDGVDSPAARAVLRFFDTWDPQAAASNPVLAPYLEEILAGATMIFKTDTGENVQDDPSVKAAWEQYRAEASADTVQMRCLVTGQIGPVARLHPSIKGIQGAQPSGASLVSYNAPAFESFGHEQGFNAPVSELAAFQYSTALNYLTADRPHVQRIADTTVLYWAESAEPMEQELTTAALFGTGNTGSEPPITDQDLKNVLQQLATGGTTLFRNCQIQRDDHFYILGLAPNASRLSVRFFLQNTFGVTLDNLYAHNQRLKIVQPSYETHHSLPLWQLLNETANQNSKAKQPPSPMAGAVLRSILMGLDYPVSLFSAVMLRIRAERDINWKKAAILKAYFLKNRGITIPKEVLNVELNPDSQYIPYVLGELFAVLEKIQVDSVTGTLSVTIRDRYFTSASATPAVVFPRLLALSQHHQRKLSEGSKRYYDILLARIIGKLQGETLPPRLTLQEQGSFYLGYYHQKADLYTKKEIPQKEEANHA